MWKTFLRKYCQVQKTQTLLSRIFLWTKETGLTYSGLQVQPALLFKRRHTAVLTRTKGVRHCAQCGLGRAGRARQEEERSEEQHWHWERRETRGKTQSLVEWVSYLLCSFCMLPIKTPKYHVPTFKVHMPSFWGLLLRKKVYKGLFLFAAGMKSKIHSDSLQNGRKLDVCLRNLDTLILKRNYHTGQKYVWNTSRLWNLSFHCLSFHMRKNTRRSSWMYIKAGRTHWYGLSQRPRDQVGEILGLHIDSWFTPCQHVKMNWFAM